MLSHYLTTKLARLLGALAAAAVMFTPAPAGAATSPDGLWADINETRIASRGTRVTIPDRYRTVQADIARLEAALRTAPAEKTGPGLLLDLPLPDGDFQTFEVWSSPIMAPELAKQFANIATYVAVAKGDAATTARLDITPAGFHGLVLAPAGTIYIDPYQAGSRTEYMSYNKHAYNKMREPHICAFSGGKIDADHGPLHSARVPVGDTLRSYRLAVAATGEYTAFHGGTVAAGQAAIVTTINRVNAIYERELAVRLNLVGNNSTVVYTNAATDPYTNFDGVTMLGENQANLDAMIGSANYDIGHVVSTGGGGIAGLGVVCNGNFKGQGVTGSGSPVGDPFDVDLVAHEIGHQFGGSHTFNGTTGSCGNDNRNAGTAYEPGSGTTIQAYAGICGAENIQLNSDDNFHTISFDEMTGYVSGGGSCFSSAATGNTPPTVDAGVNRTVPANTPLLLGTSATANDVDAGQMLTYSWEQFDLGAASPPNTDNGNRPIFRSFPPHVTAIRYLPRMSDILNGTTTLGESLPTTNRSLTFRLTVRDNAAGGGGVDSDTLVHTVTTNAGPFAVTSQGAPTNWPQNSSQTVTWDVANTTAAPVNCADVLIAFSDSGFTNFSGTTLVASTPNDGSHTFNIGALANTTTGRVMVKCTSNIFFDVNGANITVTGGGGPVCGDGIISPPEQCDDANTNGGDGCSATCTIEPGFTCSGQPSVCMPVGGNTCLSEDFENGLGNWTVFNTGAVNLDWGTTDDGFCWSGSVSVPPANVTGGAGEAACIDSDATGVDGDVVAYLCSPQFNAGTGDNAIELKFNYQIFSTPGPDDFFNLLVGTAPPGAGTIGGYTELFTTSANAGAYAALPGVDLGGQVTGANNLDLHVCVGYGANFDWYAQVDEVRWTASGGCGAQQNNPPVLDPIGDQFILIPAGGQFVMSASDPDGDELTFTATNLPFFCSLTDGGPGDNTATIACNTNQGNLGANNVTVTVTDDGVPPMDDSEQFAIVIELDSDGDLIRDIDDNCTMVANPDQRDADGDGYGTICDGDFNNDCVVNPVDLGIFRTVFFTNTAFADFNGDGVINPVDLGIFRTLFFQPVGPSGNTNVCD